MPIARHLERHSPPTACAVRLGTALHAGKDLFVAPFDFAQGKPKAYTKIYPFRDTCSLSLASVSVGTSILADDGRYPLPFSHPGCPEAGHVRTFLPANSYAVKRGDRLA